ncbi:MAG: iron chelate uptake ABC transporter family permease subunit [Verrucomicrobiota bacterium]
MIPWRLIIFCLGFWFLGLGFAHAAESHLLPSSADIWRVVSLQDYNTRIVFIGTALFGAVGGMVGTFLLLRKRSLMSDTISHATLPGIGIAFIVGELFLGYGKSLPWLMFGAAVTGLAGMGMVLAIRKLSKIKDDAALAIVLSVFFGFGIALVTMVQQMPTGNAAGLEGFIYGKAASMTVSDGWLIFSAALVAGLVCYFFYKEFKVLCFDASFAASQGWPVLLLDVALLVLITVVTVIGLQAVGLLLVVAMMIIPPAAARFWTERLDRTLLIAMGIGFISGLLGVFISALYPRLPAGAIIVLVAAALFFLSMVLGGARGMWFRYHEHHELSRRVRRQHLLRSIYEWLEVHGKRTDLLDDEFTLDDIRQYRTWTPGELEGGLQRALQHGFLGEDHPGRYHLTGKGARDALRVVRNHRLWELFLIQYADIAPGRVDRDADAVEHILEPDILQELEELLEDEDTRKRIPLSPHRLNGAVHGGAA